VREIYYLLDKENRNQTVALKARIEDRFGTTKIPLARLHGWRKELLTKHIKLEPKTYDETFLIFIAMKTLRYSKNRDEALRYLDRVKELGKMELHFWASKFLLNEKKAFRAWRALYG